MEITAQMQANQAMGFLQTQQTQLGTLESQIASGIGLQQSSDNPGAFATVMQDNAQNLNYSTYLTTISSATNTLNTSVSALNNIQSIVTQASSITQQGINGATGVSGLSALASQSMCADRQPSYYRQFASEWAVYFRRYGNEYAAICHHVIG